ncbi:MAG: redoxin domain-containing protein [Chloroflexi bacterium]|nr:redoxin domain-containing protein [Chloroflexota bacterium]
MFVITYDAVEALAAFANLYGIQYPLLSDKGSAVIKRFGILNTLIKPEETEHYGIPYPGSYLVGEDGRIVAKYFNREYQVRETGATVLHSGFKLPVDPATFVHGEASEGGVHVSAALAATALRYMQHADLYVTFDLDPGLHIYGPSVPEGYVPTEVTVTGAEGLRIGDAEFPPTKPFRVEGLPDEFQVWEGKAAIRVPIINGIREGASVTLNITLRYQACDDHQCYVPKTKEFILEVPLGPQARAVQ